jgi:transketolase
MNRIEKLDILKGKLSEIAKNDENTYFVCLDAFSNIIFGDLHEQIDASRIINAGISEQNAVGFAAGLAISGKKVYLCITSTFLSTRALEQLKLDISYNNANVTVISLKPGIADNPKAGYSHWAIEDICTVKNFPNIKLFSIGTHNELEYVMDHSAKEEGPLYVRMPLHDVFNVGDSKKVELGKMTHVLPGNSFVIMAHGKWALDYACEYARKMNKQRLSPIVLSSFSLDPFDKETVEYFIRRNIPIVTLEEHGFGGLSSIVSEIIAKSKRKVKFFPIYIDNLEFNTTGNPEFLLEKTMNLSAKFNEVSRYINRFKYLKLLLPFYTKYNIGKNAAKVTKYYKCYGLPILKIVSKNNLDRYYMFGLIPLLKKGKTN